MKQKYCAVVAKEFEVEKRILSTKNDVQSGLRCQFTGSLQPEYVYEEEHFCILHLPLKEKQKSPGLVNFAKDAFYDALELDEDYSNFSLISVDGVTIEKTRKELNFNGATISNIRFNNTIIDTIIFSNICMKGYIIFENCRIRQVILNNSLICAYHNFNDCEIEHFNLNASYLASYYEIPRLSDNNSLVIKGGSISKLSFIKNRCNVSIKLETVKVHLLDMRDCTFMLCPSFFNTELSSDASEIILPKKEAYMLDDLMKPLRYPLYSKLIKYIWPKYIYSEGRNKFMNDISVKIKHYSYYLEEQKRNYREIYNLTKNRLMYEEQGEYFALMQRCNEKNPNSSWFSRITSMTYSFVSSYGTSIGRPLVWLFIVYITSSLSYKLVNPNIKHYSQALMLSLHQIVSPFSIWKDSNDYLVNKVVNIMKLIGMIESLSTLIFLSLFLLALRWRFRKA